MLNILKKVFGSKHDKDVKALLPIVEEINSIYAGLASLSDEDLRARTDTFRAQINEAVAPLVTQVEEIRQTLESDSSLDHTQRANLYAKLADLDREQFTTIQSVLDDILPDAFATVKEACRRLVGHRYMVVGHEQVWDMIPYDVQLIGGIVLHQGKISEMATGEGKTLVATLPLYLNALAGRGVHLVTVNDYLARRDREWMKPMFDMLGITSAVIQSGHEVPEVRQEQYRADITYGTNNEFGFDYLRDNMADSMARVVQRPHWYAIIDEVDSVLIDEARTPLIISGTVQSASTDRAFVEMNPRVKKLVEAQTRLVNTFVAEAEKLLQSTDKAERIRCGVALLSAHRGMPKHKRLAKLLQEPEGQKLLREAELEHLKEQGQRMHLIDDELYFSVDERNHQIDISEKGRQLLATAQEDPEMFLIPDVAAELSALEHETSLSPEELQARKDAIMMTFAERSDRIHVINQLLRAYTLYFLDDEYVVQDGKVKIVDEFTGRILEGRRYSDGLHQAIEAKEGVQVERDTQTFATITLQNYFRLYHKLAGMTGTAETEAAEFYEIYKLDVVVIPTNKPLQRKDLDDFVYRTKREKYNAVIEAIQGYLNEGRAVLVGTASVEVSEVLSKMLKRVNIPHNVLNAKQHQREAEIVMQAGRKGAVTIATNMAGRGTDIKLDPEVKANGGLAIIGTERHESRRIDRQLRGRAGRQGDPGSSQFFISLEDDLMRLFGGERIAGIMQAMKVPEGEPMQAAMVTKAVTNAQKKVESNNFSMRKRLLEYDNVMNLQREVIYDRRRHALQGERLKADLFEYIREMAGDWYDATHSAGDVETFLNDVRATLLCNLDIADENAFRALSREQAIDLVVEAATEFYERKEAMLGHDFMLDLERYAALRTIDEKWREHLRGMDDLKEGIYLRAYGQKDPLLEYKQEAYGVFVELVKDINKETVHFAFRYFPQRVAAQPAPTTEARATNPEAERSPTRPAVPAPASVSASRSLSFSKPTVTTTSSGGAVVEGGSANTSRTVRNEGREMGRNEPCPFDPSKKFKNCCGATGSKVCTKA
jgi:preprotein translocase subunit SecA